MAVLIPHFDLPFRYSGTSPCVAEQDSIEDVVNCVQAILQTAVGERVEVPEFGIDAPVLRDQPLDVAGMLGKVNQFEPRADAVFSQHPDVADRLIADVTVNVQTKGV